MGTTREAIDKHALGQYICATLGEEYGGVAEIDQFDHGQSNPTFLVETQNGVKLVMRKKPHGNLLPSAHAVEREFHVLRALNCHAPQVPVPQALALCEDTHVIGTPFYFMEYVEGRIFRDPTLRDVLNPLHRYAMYSAVVDALAAFHALDYRLLGLDNFGRASTNYSQRVLARWSKQVKRGQSVFDRAGVPHNPQFDALQEWLGAHVEEAESETGAQPALVHGDFRIDNVIFHPTEPRVLAILDWELCTIGNPFLDLATFASSYHFPSRIENCDLALPGLMDSDISLQKLGIPSEYDVIIGYCDRVHRCLPRESSWRFFLGLICFRFAAICHGVYARSIQGNASSAHASDSKVAMDAILELGLRVVQCQESIYRLSTLDHQLPFPIRPHVRELYTKLVSFCEQKVFPAEHVHHQQLAAAREEGHEWTVVPQVIEELKIEAKKLGLWNLFLPTMNVAGNDSGRPEEEYGADLTNVEYGLLCEVMGRSIVLAPEVFNCSAPDTGNMEILARFATPSQKQQWLVPLLEGDIRSCFAMTEKRVASSDATNIETQIVRDEKRQEYVINGTKFYISGAGDPRCKLSIVMGKVVSSTGARPSHRFRSQSMILVPMDSPGIKIVRPMHVFGYDDAPHGHMEMHFQDVRVPFENILLGEGRGFEIAQARLGPGRIHHCMRAIGAAERCLQLMLHRAKTRTAFGKLLAENDLVRAQIAESRCELDSARLLTLQAAHAMDTQGNKAAAQAIAMIKVVAPNTALRICDRAIQMHGATGVSQDTPLSYLYAGLRTLRIADGPDEVHLRTIAKIELTSSRL